MCSIVYSAQNHDLHYIKLSLGVFHKDPKLNLSLSWTYWKPLTSLKIFCKSYFKVHKILIQMIHIFYYPGDFMFLMWNLSKVQNTWTFAFEYIFFKGYKWLSIIFKSNLELSSTQDLCETLPLSSKEKTLVWFVKMCYLLFSFISRSTRSDRWRYPSPHHPQSGFLQCTGQAGPLGGRRDTDHCREYPDTARPDRGQLGEWNRHQR